VVAFSGLPITVNPGAGGTVVLRGLTLKSASAGSGTGITHESGTLFVENSVIDGWNIGLRSQGTAENLFVKGSVLRNQSDIALLVSIGATVAFAIDDSFFEKNAYGGVVILGGTGRVSNSVMTRNTVGVEVDSLGVVASVQRCEVSNNISGLFASSSAILHVSGSTIARNSYGVENFLSGATVESSGNNVIRWNFTANTVGTITPVGLQ
jgi:hypothetical protein